MKVSVCITVLNEEHTIFALVESLLNQSLKPDEIIIVDGGSTDGTTDIIKHLQKKDKSIKLLKENCSRSEGRNIAVEIASNNIIAMTDAGCVARADWLRKITDPLKHKEVGVVAGFYKMITDSPKGKAISFFFGVTPDKFDHEFLPSTRSIAFKKEVWEKVGGFPESIKDCAEDTMFNFKLVNNNISISRVKDAIVEWRTPQTLSEAFKKLQSYAKGDAKTRIIIFPNKGIMSHNIKVILVFLRYFLGVVLIGSLISNPRLPFYLSILFFLYIFWSFRKVYLVFNNVFTGLWGIVMQFISDFAVMSGFIKGLINK